MARRRRSRKRSSAKCSNLRARISSAHGKRARGKALGTYMANCRRGALRKAGRKGGRKR